MFCGGYGHCVVESVMYMCVQRSQLLFYGNIHCLAACVVFWVVGMVALLHWHTTVCSVTAFKVLPMPCY